jgi:hypothetical protein
VSAKLTVPRGVDSPVKEGALNTDQQVVDQLLGTRPIDYSDLNLKIGRLSNGCRMTV